MALSSLQRGSLVQLAISQLRAQITAGAWPVGARIPAEPELGETLGIGRSTLREAVRALAQEGLLEIRRGSGTFVVSDSTDAWTHLIRRAAVLEVYEVRAGLEYQAARLAAQRADEADLERIEAALQVRMTVAEEGNEEAFVEADLAFHRAVVAAAHNDLLSELYTSFLPVLRDGLSKLSAGRDLRRAGIDVHVRDAHATLFDKIRNGDVEGALAATEENLETTADALRSAVSRSAEQ